MQWQLAAKERLATYESIMEASSDNAHIFLKLIKWQRDGGFNSQADMEFPHSTAGHTEGDKWADYFTKLAMPKCLPEFDDEHKKNQSTCSAYLLAPSPPVVPPPMAEAAQV